MKALSITVFVVAFGIFLTPRSASALIENQSSWCSPEQRSCDTGDGTIGSTTNSGPASDTFHGADYATCTAVGNWAQKCWDFDFVIYKCKAVTYAAHCGCDDSTQKRVGDCSFIYVY